MCGASERNLFQGVRPLPRVLRSCRDPPSTWARLHGLAPGGPGATREGDAMNTCPTCGSTKTVVDVASRRILCITCGTRWIKRPWRGGAGVRVLDPAHPSIRGRRAREG